MLETSNEDLTPLPYIPYKNHALSIIEYKLTNILERNEIAISYKADSLYVFVIFYS
jgi:hypothetical protein